MPILIEAKVTQAPSNEDKVAMLRLVADENATRDEENQLPTDTNVELRDSYEVVLAKTLAAAHQSFIEQSFRLATDEIKSLIDEFDADDLDQLTVVIERLKARRDARNAT